MPERRKSQRIAVFLEIKEIDHRPLDDTYLLNFSESGAKIETPFEYAPGDRIDFVFVLPDKITEISRQGQVVWARPAAKPGTFLVGLEFNDAWELGKKAD